MKAGYKIDCGKFTGNMNNFFHVFNYPYTNEYCLFEFQEKIKEDNCIGVWKLKNKKQ